METKKEQVRFSMRFNLKLEHHQKAWEKLSQIPAGERTEYLILGLLDNETMHPIEYVVKAVIRKEIRSALQEVVGKEKWLTKEVDRLENDNINQNQRQMTDSISEDVIAFMQSL